jgi:hypothetical protein
MFTPAAALAIAVGLLAGPFAANAREAAGGWVTSFDGTRLTLLNDPGIYHVPPGLDTTAMATMAIAHLGFEMVGDRRVVTDLKITIPDAGSSSSSSSWSSSSSSSSD